MKLVRKSLDAFKVERMIFVDEDAERVRLMLVTPGAAQMQVYAWKATEAARFKATGILDPVTHLAEEAELRGITPDEMADMYLTYNSQWYPASIAIEKARQKAKIAIKAATTTEEVVQASIIDWNAVLSG
jgi:hypothetical protein